MIQHRSNYRPEPTTPRSWFVLFGCTFVFGCYALAQMWDALP